MHSFILNQLIKAPVFNQVRPNCKFTKDTDSCSKEIISYLFDNGNTLGSKLIEKLNLNHSPAHYLRKHIMANRITKQKFGQNKALYGIAEGLTKQDFGI